jgi:N,N'-diacetylchitobiose non-reducing end deacetylase
MSPKFTFPKPDIFQAKKILCIQPHYDDNDIGAGGTLAALYDQGATLFYLTATDDLMGVIDTSLSAEEASAQLKREQKEAGEIIGVSEHYWLGFPDAGSYDYFALRKAIIKHIRLLRPDFIFTVDPWLPYEAHMDHSLVGRAASEAAILYGLLRLASDPEIDQRYEPHQLAGIAYYHTHAPNTYVDISRQRERKHRAIDCYKAQFSPEDMQRLHYFVDLKEQEFADGKGCSHAEPLKVIHPIQLHCQTDTWSS